MSAQTRLRLPRAIWEEQMHLAALPRARKMAEMRRKGWTLEAIGWKFKVSRQRVHALLKMLDSDGEKE